MIDDVSAEEKEGLECTVKVEDSGPWKKKVCVQIPRAQIDKELNSQYGELAKSALVPGFRKGHAPRKLFEKRYGEDLSNQAKLRLLAQAFEKIDAEQDFEVLGEPDFDPEKVELPAEGDLDFEYEVEVKPEFELPGLEGVKIEKQIVEVTDERVSEAIMELRRRGGRMEEVKQAEENDVVWADVTMKVEGVEEPEKSEGVMIRVAGASVLGVWIEDMAEVLEGVKAGEERQCSAKVPDIHEKEEYRDKQADFTLAVKNIRRLVPVEMNEDFFASIGVENEDELRRQIQETLEDRVDQEVRRDMVQQVYKYLQEQIEFELPEGVAGRYAQRVLARQYYDLARQGVSQEKIEENMEKLRASSSAQAAQELKMSFIMERAAEKLEVEVGEAELNGFIAQMAAQQRRRPERLREELEREGRLESLRGELREQRALDRILEMAEVVDAPVKEKKEKQEKPKKKRAVRSKKKEDEKEVVEKTTKKKDSEKPKKKSSRKEVKRKPPEDK